MIDNLINKNTKKKDIFKEILEFKFNIDIFLLDYLNFSLLYEDKLNIDELKNILKHN